MTLPTLSEATLSGKRVLVRAGFDVPLKEGNVTDTSRIVSMVPTIQHLLEQGASIVLLAHQGRPKGERVPELSQKPLVPELEKLLGTSVQFCEECVGPTAKAAAEALKPGEVLLLENLRYDDREKKNDPEFAKELASLGDVYVNDAFTNCHRAHASMVGIPEHLPSYMGLSLEQEVAHLSSVFEDPRRPVVLIVAGAKMETKVPVIESFLGYGDDVLLGGCIANTFIAARGFDVGASKYEDEHVSKAQEIMLEGEKEGTAFVHVPRDGVLASEPKEGVATVDLPVEDIEGDMAIFDIGSVTAKRYCDMIEKAGTVIWNGPVGFYEIEAFAGGSKKIAEATAKATANGATTIIGGGDTIDFHTRYGYDLGAYSFVSMGGGAMLEFLSGKTLPALAALEKHAVAAA